ncbi:Hypothetical protein NTJ_08746 [Nesidiocoris tenuis]|uniref:Uncharacterized protein n=1 Tax=Nesidiocoris tenuis TaxID=355587 RepID=A0ABN7AUT0_9HEMI|nr:Hypothetical protein NTJ_08746 [Nesidiocoris tenuis]
MSFHEYRNRIEPLNKKQINTETFERKLKEMPCTRRYAITSSLRHRRGCLVLSGIRRNALERHDWPRLWGPLEASPRNKTRRGQLVYSFMPPLPPPMLPSIWKLLLPSPSRRLNG